MSNCDSDEKIVLGNESFDDTKFDVANFRSFQTRQQTAIKGKGTDDTRKAFEELSLKFPPSKQVDMTKHIVKLFTVFNTKRNQEYMGTGTIINIYCGQIYVLTCAHNVKTYDRSSNKKYFIATNIWFFYEQNGVKFEFIGKDFCVHPNYRATEDRSGTQDNEGYDMAVILFEMKGNNNTDLFEYSLLNNLCSIDDYVPRTIDNNTESDKEIKLNGYILGYPGEKHGKDANIWGMKGELIIRNYSEIMYHIYTTPGQSGSAIIVDDNGAHKIFGIHTDGGGHTNFGTLLDANKLEWIKKNMTPKINVPQYINNESNIEKIIYYFENYLQEMYILEAIKNKTYIPCIVSGVLMALLIMRCTYYIIPFIIPLIQTLVCFIIPAYYTLKSLDTKNFYGTTDQLITYKNWLRYWLFAGILILFDSVFVGSWIDGNKGRLIRIGFHLFLYSKYTQGSTFLFKRINFYQN